MLYFAAIFQIISERMLLILRFKPGSIQKDQSCFEKKFKIIKKWPSSRNFSRKGLHRSCLPTFVDGCRSFYAPRKLYDKLLRHKIFSRNSGKFNVFDFLFQNIIRKKCSSINAIILFTRTVLTSYYANHNSAHEIKKFKDLYACDLVQILSGQTLFVFYSNK